VSVQTPEEMVEEARQLLNRRVEELQRQNGIEEHSDLSVGACVKVIQALDMSGYTRRQMEHEQDRELIRSTVWHQASLLSVYLDVTSEEYKRDLYQYGVYVLFELIGNKEVPLLVEAFPRYVGESGVLSQRLKNHANGSFQSNPGDHVIREFLQTCSEAERAAYAVASKPEQTELRRMAMAHRGMWVRTAHTESKTNARELEHAMCNYYRSQGYDLWNVRP
jgi:hypothetical protein